MRILYGLAASASGFSAMVALDIYRRWSSPFQSTKGALNHYVAVVFLSFLGKRMRAKLDKDTKQCRVVQEEFLLGQVQKNKNTVYGIDVGLNKIKGREDYTRLLPLTIWDDYGPYIDRVAKGEENVMLPGRPTILAMTSGTSGKSHMLPMWKEQQTFFFLHGIATIFETIFHNFPATRNLQRSLKIFYTPKFRESEAGITIGPNSSSPANSKQILNLYTTPKPGFDIMSEPEATYIHLLFGLKDRDLGTIEGNFVSLVYTALMKMTAEWEQLVTDIENGHIHEGLNIEENTREELNKFMKPDKKRAAELRQEFQKGFDGIVKRIWPKMNIILGVDTGTFEIYGKILRSGMCQDIPFYSPIYACTEGLLGLNLFPQRHIRQYLLSPRSMFFEFIPVDHMEEEQPATLFVDQVDIGESYELVITNQGGLYRYRFGDVVKVVDFYHTAPVVEFQYRKGQLLNVRAEKTSEETFYRALEQAEENWAKDDIKVIDYCCAEHIVVNAAKGDNNTTDNNPSYSVFLELASDKKHPALGEEQKSMIDDNLQEISFVYSSFRTKGSIGPMNIHIVKEGTFLELREFMIRTTSASSNQYKVPRVMRRIDAVKFLLDRVTG
ncbi:uncharacterized protein LOC135493858 isoform X2 [Lineus longissimus]